MSSLAKYGQRRGRTDETCAADLELEFLGHVGRDPGARVLHEERLDTLHCVAFVHDLVESVLVLAQEEHAERRLQGA